MVATTFSPDDAARLHAAVISEDLPAGEPQAFVAAARTALDLGRHDDAAALAKAALALSPSHAAGWVVLGDAAWLGGDAEAARRAWEEALSLDDKDLGTAISCARAQLQTGAPRAARALLTYVLTRTTSDALREAANALLDDDSVTPPAAEGAR